VTPDDLLAAATTLLHRAIPTGWRAIGVAVLSRQALEMAIDDYWRHAAPEATAANRSTQLLCLPSYADQTTAELAAQTWVSLSGACHVRAYDLPPSPDELARWLTDTGAVIAGLRPIGAT
jgi:hypothetical protein